MNMNMKMKKKYKTIWYCEIVTKRDEKGRKKEDYCTYVDETRLVRNEKPVLTMMNELPDKARVYVYKLRYAVNFIGKYGSMRMQAWR